MTTLGKIGSVLVLFVAGGGAFAAANASSERQTQSTGDSPVTNTVLYNSESVLGKELIASGEAAGRIVDVLADEFGRVRAVVVDYGGFLGVGTRKIAIAWSDLRFAPDGSGGAVAVDLPRDRLSTAPEVKTGKPVVVISAYDQAASGMAEQ